MAKAIYPFEPKFSIYGLNKPLAITGNVGLSKPVVASVSAWLDG